MAPEGAHRHLKKAQERRRYNGRRKKREPSTWRKDGLKLILPNIMGTMKVHRAPRRRRKGTVKALRGGTRRRAQAPKRRRKGAGITGEGAVDLTQRWPQVLPNIMGTMKVRRAPRRRRKGTMKALRGGTRRRAQVPKKGAGITGA